jgi:hypothetical protein
MPRVIDKKKAETTGHAVLQTFREGAARVGDEPRFSLAAIYRDMEALLRALIEQAGPGAGEAPEEPC